jgi:hypothetical protein
MSSRDPEFVEFCRRFQGKLRRESLARAGSALRLQADLCSLLAEARRLSPNCPVDVVMFCLDALPQAHRVLLGLKDGARLASEILDAVALFVVDRCVEDRRLGQRSILPRHVVSALLKLWLADEEGWFEGFQDHLLDLAALDDFFRELKEQLVAELAAIPLTFASTTDGEPCARHASLAAERHALERFLGELLARRGQHEFALVVAREHGKRTGQGSDVVRCLLSLGREPEALAYARERMEDASCPDRETIGRLKDEITIRNQGERTRERRKDLERLLLDRPSREAMDALKGVFAPVDWQKHRERLMKLLMEHQRAPDLVFELLIEDDRFLEARSLAQVQDVSASRLLSAAQIAQIRSPDVAPSLAILAAYRFAGVRDAKNYGHMGEALEIAERTCALSDHPDSWDEAIEGLRASHGNAPAFRAVLKRLGVETSPDRVRLGKPRR